MPWETQQLTEERRKRAFALTVEGKSRKEIAAELKLARMGVSVPPPKVNRFKPEMEIQGDAQEYRIRRGMGAGMVSAAPDLAENRPLGRYAR